MAARMEQLASPGAVRLTADTLKLAEGYVEVPVKGLAEPIEVYEITGAGPVRRRFEAAAVRGLTRGGKHGEPWRDRTSDPLIKSQALCQLS